MRQFGRPRHGAGWSFQLINAQTCVALTPTYFPATECLGTATPDFVATLPYTRLRVWAEQLPRCSCQGPH